MQTKLAARCALRLMKLQAPKKLCAAGIGCPIGVYNASPARVSGVRQCPVATVLCCGCPGSRLLCVRAVNLHRSWVHKPTCKRGQRPVHYAGTRKPRASNLGDDMSHTFPHGPAASSPAAAAAVSEPTGALSFALCLVVGCTEPAGRQKYDNKAHTPAQRFIVPRVCTKHSFRLRRAKAAARLHSLWSDEELVFDQRRQRAIAPA